MVTMQKYGWTITGSTVEELLIAAQVIEKLSASSQPNGIETDQIAPPTPRQRHPRESLGNEILAEIEIGKKSRIQQLEEFLCEHGPMKRNDVIERSGIPAGTVNTTLNDKNFVQLSDGRWTGERVGSPAT
jgi:hypothetical protein